MSPDQPIPVQHSAVKGVAKFDFTAESDDELTLKVSVCACVRAHVCLLEGEFCQNYPHCNYSTFQISLLFLPAGW